MYNNDTNTNCRNRKILLNPMDGVYDHSSDNREFPNELWSNIFVYLPVRYLKSLCFVNHQLNMIGMYLASGTFMRLTKFTDIALI